MINDKIFCMSSFLMYRTIVDSNKKFGMGSPNLFIQGFESIPIKNSTELEDCLNDITRDATDDGKAALMLSGGIDSAILAKFMPIGSKVYTLKCVVPGRKVTDETSEAFNFAHENGLSQEIVEIYWEDFERYAPVLMKHKGAPIHSIEIQIYKAALKAKADGFDKLIFGESADAKYGGFDSILSNDYTIGEFVDRYSYVLPYKVLKDFKMIIDPYSKYERQGYIDVHKFLNDIFYKESMGSYANACETAGIEFIAPFAHTYMDIPLDFNKVRNNNSKYLVRDIFKKYYSSFMMPKKIPMPRPMTEWLSTWEGPKRSEFWEHSTDNFTGDQKWLVYCLENYLNMIDGYKK